MNRTDKERRKQIMKDLRVKSQEEFESCLPMDNDEFVRLNFV